MFGVGVWMWTKNLSYCENAKQCRWDGGPVGVGGDW